MRKRKGIAVIAAIVMTAVMSLGGSLAATTVGMKDGAAAVTVDQTVVGFGGHEWWVIGDAKGGVYSQENSVTLLSKNHNDDFGDSAFNEENNWSTTEPANVYKRSTLQKRMDEIATKNISAKERIKINDRTLRNTDGINGDDVENQKVWALSQDEYLKIGSKNVRSYGSDNWLRSFYKSLVIGALYTPANGDLYNNVYDVVYNNKAVRPALNLNTSSVLFTSNAGDSGKASATPGGGLVSVTAPDTTSDGNKIKYTFKDDSLKLGNVYVSKIENNTVTVKYDGATAGKSLSVITRDDSGTVTHYGKLAEKITAGGEGSFTLPEGFDSSKNKTEIFVEEIGKDDNYSDFASTPKALDMTVKNMVTVNGGSGSGLYTEGKEVTLTADPAPEGKYFKGWNISPEVTLKDGGTVTSGIIKFDMPGKAVTATAVYEDVYTVSVTGGTGGGEYAEGEEVTITANQPDSGKYFKGWSISPEVTLKGGGIVTSGIIKFDMPAHAVTATAEYEDMIVYPVKDGDNTGWTQGDQGGLIITSEGEHRKFTDVSVDGAVLDRQHYTVESGSTIVTLKESYLRTLSVGEHVMRIHFTDGYTETKFNIQAQQTDKPAPPTTDPGEPTTPVEPGVQPGEPNPPVQGGTTAATTVTSVGTSPKTGDGSRIWITVSLMLGAAMVFMAVSAFKKSKQI